MELTMYAVLIMILGATATAIQSESVGDATIQSKSSSDTVIQSESSSKYLRDLNMEGIKSNNRLIGVDQHGGIQNDDKECELKIMHSDIDVFRHEVFYNDYNYVYLNLTPVTNVTINVNKYIVGGNIWVWTFYGKSGGLEFLSWPIEFGIWSLRLLAAYIYGPMKIHLEHQSGDCSNLTIGERKSDVIIARALTNLTTVFFTFGENYKEKYGPSFYCYKRRMLINPRPLYVLCKHVVCPIEALEYSCLNFYYDVKRGHRVIDGHEENFEYDVLWWVLPSVAAFFLFVFFPLLLLNFCWRCNIKTTDVIGRHYYLLDHATPTEPNERIIWLDGRYHVTLFNTIFGPIISVVANRQNACSRLARFFVPFLSLTVIGIQLILDYCYLYSFVMTSINSGVPLGFRSMIAGFEKSSKNFLPYLKGPYIALGGYLSLTCIFAIIPRSLGSLLEKGLGDNTNIRPNTPLRLPLRVIERLGSVPIRGRSGYLKVYSVFLGQFYMLFNIRYWKEAASIQVERWKRLAPRKLTWVIFPIYIVTCVLEMLLCFLLYSMPILSFCVTVIRAYARLFFRINRHRRTNCIRKTLCCVLLCGLVLGVMFFLYMFCTIFLDATLFTTRIFIFTFTGIIMYPKLSYGYIIFTFTVIYYMWDCFTKFSFTYQKLLEDTIQACRSVLPANTANDILVVSGGFRGVQERLYEHVIEAHCPRRKQVFVSLLKLVIVLAIIGISIDLLRKTDRFRELHITVHVATALFTCALPQILKSMCSVIDDKYQRVLFKRELRRTVKEYVRSFQQEYGGDGEGDDEK